MPASFWTPRWMIALDGSLVPSITTVLPAGGADFSGVLIVILAGVAWYFWSSALACVTPESEDAALPAAPLAPAVDVELEELDEPHAASPTAVASVQVRAERRTPRRRHLTVVVCGRLCMSLSLCGHWLNWSGDCRSASRSAARRRGVRPPARSRYASRSP